MTKEQIHRAIDQLTDEQLMPVVDLLEGQSRSSIEDPDLAALKAIPGIRLPAQWPPRFEHFELIEVEGEPVSEQLVRERR